MIEKSVNQFLSLFSQRGYWRKAR